MATPQTAPLRTTENTIRVIDALRELKGAGVTTLADELGMSKSTVHDHLSTLRAHDYVVKNGDTYDLGLGFFEVGEYARKRRKIYEIARPEVTNLADQTGEVANLMVEEHGRGVYLFRAHGDNAVTLDTHTGKRRYLHNTALGKAILANFPEQRVHEVLDTHGLPKETQYTITDRETLFDSLEEIRERGVAYCGQERVEGLQCVAAPILSTDDRVLGAISVAGPTTRIKGERFKKEIPELVSQAANVIEINVTYG
ncbi:IclR family transcriptional regulator [Natrononativus amylolyticus]|uniref:IclR family transcriptional regulator n=1 Tax=Natrononativus amylolyticus TaxID=2963434 RepID=UPI0020CB8BA7|nr:IclR family transcriptional regulator [Natrononativus amylolyticus]